MYGRMGFPERAKFGGKRVKTEKITITHVDEVAPAVAVLAALEDQAYSLYYGLKTRQWNVA